MADKFARVDYYPYTIRGMTLSRGTIVQLTAAQLKATGDHNPPKLVEVAAPKEGTPVVDIRPKAMRGALAASESGPAPERPPLKKK
jgi:hypothetical protein